MAEVSSYIVILAKDISKLDFKCLSDTSQDTVRKSIDEKKAVIEYEGEMPDCIKDLEGTEGPFDHKGIVAELSSKDWIAGVS
jgi:hypothetical protein